MHAGDRGFLHGSVLLFLLYQVSFIAKYLCSFSLFVFWFFGLFLFLVSVNPHCIHPNFGDLCGKIYLEALMKIKDIGSLFIYNLLEFRPSLLSMIHG